MGQKIIGQRKNQTRKRINLNEFRDFRTYGGKSPSGEGFKWKKS